MLSRASTATAESKASIDPMSAITRAVVSNCGRCVCRMGATAGDASFVNASGAGKSINVTPSRGPSDTPGQPAATIAYARVPATIPISAQGSRGHRRATIQHSATVAIPSATPPNFTRPSPSARPEAPAPCGSPRSVSTCAIAMSSARPSMKPATTGSGTKLTRAPKRSSAKSTCSNPESATQSAVSSSSVSTSNPRAVARRGSLASTATNPAKMTEVELLTLLPGTSVPPTSVATRPPTITVAKAAGMPTAPAAGPSAANDRRPSGSRMPSETTALDNPPRSSPASPALPVHPLCIVLTRQATSSGRDAFVVVRASY